MKRISALALVVGLVGACQVNTGEEPGTGVPGGSGGAGGGAGTAGTPPATGGSSGSAGAATGGGGAGGSAGSVAGGAGRGGMAGTGAGGMTSGGRAGSGSSGAGMSAGGTAAGGSGGAAAGSAGTSSCAGDIRCQLDPLPSTGDVYQDCVNRINQFRAECACLPPLERWTDGEACADQMAEYDSMQASAHAGFIDGICSGGSAQNECPGWRSEAQVVEGCLQSMWDEGPPPTSTCNGACFQMYGHFINMTDTRYTKVACGFYTAGNEVWAVQNFSR